MKIEKYTPRVYNDQCERITIGENERVKGVYLKDVSIGNSEFGPFIVIYFSDKIGNHKPEYSMIASLDTRFGSDIKSTFIAAGTKPYISMQFQNKKLWIGKIKGIALNNNYKYEYKLDWGYDR